MGDFSNLITKGGGAVAYAILEDQKASGTAGGTFTSGAWQTRDLNTITSDPNSIVSISSNQFTLQAGTYEIEAHAPAYNVGSHLARLQNITDAITEGEGSSSYTTTMDSSSVTSNIIVEVSLSSPKTFEIQNRCSLTKSVDGFGPPNLFATCIYTQVKITKLG